MLTDWARRSFRFILDPLSRFLGWIGVSPNALTLFGLALHVGVAYILATGHFTWGGLATLAASAFDALDGSLARHLGRVSKFGAFLDSTIDRYSEAVLYLGLTAYFLHAGQPAGVILSYVAIIGSQLVSYTRARAEAIGVECKEGLLTRVERAIILVFFLLIHQVFIGLWVIAILANLTALQRILTVWRKTRSAVSVPSHSNSADHGL
jgi:CDP-diacylglycerol---glycerol-3-phosphate 3-phosphatidyltransferase